MEARIKSHYRTRKGRMELVRDYAREYEPIPPEALTLKTHVTLPDFEMGVGPAVDAVSEACERLINEQLKYNRKLGKYEKLLRRGISYIKETIKEKADIKKQYRELKTLGKKHGPVFMAYAIAIELLEDVVLPAILTKMGHPEFTPILLAWHSEWFMYPLYFGVAKLLRKHKKLEKAFYYVIMES